MDKSSVKKIVIQSGQIWWKEMERVRREEDSQSSKPKIMKISWRQVHPFSLLYQVMIRCIVPHDYIAHQISLETDSQIWTWTPKMLYGQSKISIDP